MIKGFDLNTFGLDTIAHISVDHIDKLAAGGLMTHQSAVLHLSQHGGNGRVSQAGALECGVLQFFVNRRHRARPTVPEDLHDAKLKITQPVFRHDGRAKAD